MAVLAKELRPMIAESLGTGASRPHVHDGTGLTGTFDFELEYSCAANCGPPFPPPGLQGVAQRTPEPEAPGQPAHLAAENSGSGLPNILVALEEQLGLKLIKAKAVPVDVIVVDHIDKAPIEN